MSQSVVVHTLKICAGGWSTREKLSVLLMRNEPFYRTVEIFLNTGTVEKKMYNVDNLPFKLNDIMQLIILQLVLDHLGIYF